MKITTKGFFALKTGDTCVILDQNKNEIGKMDVQNGYCVVTIKDDDELRMDEAQTQAWFDEKGYILTKDSPRWIEYNPNPSNNTKANDCTVRAYCAAENLEWDEAYDIACKYGKNYAFMPSDKTTVARIVEDEFGYTEHKLSKEEKDQKMTLNDFAIKNCDGTYLVMLPGHLVAVVDGEYYDSWDSGKKRVQKYFSKK